MYRSECPLLSHVVFPSSFVGRRVSTHPFDRAPALCRQWGPSPVARAVSLLVLVTFFCWCGVFCVACASCGTCAVFSYTDAFNQDIGSWDVSTVTAMVRSKCLPSLARSFPSCIDPRPFTCRACGLHLPHSLPLQIRSKTF